MALCMAFRPRGQLEHLMGVCEQLGPPGHDLLVQQWSEVRWASAHSPQRGELMHVSWWWPNVWHLWHCDVRRSGGAFMILQLRLKMAMLLMPAVWTFSEIEMMIVSLPRALRTSGRVSHLEGCVREMFVDLKILSAMSLDNWAQFSVPIKDGTLWTTNWDQRLFG